MRNLFIRIRHQLAKWKWRFIAEFRLHPIENYGSMLQSISFSICINNALVCFVLPWLATASDTEIDYTFSKLNIIIFLINCLFAVSIAIIGKSLIRIAHKTWMN